MYQPWTPTNEQHTNPSNVLDAWGAGDADDWTATTPDEVEQALRDQVAQNPDHDAPPVTDEQYRHDAAIIARWISDNRSR